MTTALITGATSGIGLELAKIMAKDGINLVLVARSTDILNSIKLDIESQHNVSVQVITSDLSKPKAAQSVFSETTQPIDYLVNNAGFGDFELFKDADLAKQTEMIQLNITALTELSHLFVQGMVERKNGRILNIASTAAFQPGPWMSVYYATKAYVLSFSEAISYELRNSGVTVTALCPGATETGFQDAADAENSKLFSGRKLPTAEEVAEYGYKMMLKGKRTKIHGFMNKTMAASVRFTPRNLILPVVDMIAGKKGA